MKSFPNILGFYFFFLLLNLSSCASVPPSVQPQVNSLIVANQPDRALKVLESQKDAYGPNNALLYTLDKAMVLHLSQKYSESVSFFEDAQRMFDDLYTQSISKGLATWVINDYADAYHGEDFEHALVNVFQALNFVSMNNFEDALVEARDVDSKLAVINSQYRLDQKNVYREDAFIRLLMGILYEAGQNSQDDNDAFISYRKAVAIYEKDYLKNYGVAIPKILQENVLAAAAVMGSKEFVEVQNQFPQTPFLTLPEKRKKGQIIFVQYNGLAPIKIQTSIPIPLPGGIITKLAFPSYHERFYETKKTLVIARPVGQTTSGVQAETELVEDVGKIAVQNLENRKFRVLAKAVLRPAGKYFAERAAQEAVRDKYGNGAALGVGIASSIFNLVSEQADIRSWQTLPAEIRIARLVVDPGRYHVRVDSFDQNQILLEERQLKDVDMKAGEMKFVIARTVK